MGFSLQSLCDRMQRKHTVYISSRTTSIFLRGKALVLCLGESEHVMPLQDIRRVVILGKADIPAAILYKFMRLGLATDWLDAFGRPVGALVPMTDTSASVRLAQDQFCKSDNTLALGKSIIAAKMENVAELMRRRDGVPGVWFGLRKKLERATTAEQVRGLEGAAARIFFSKFSGWCPAYPWQGRKPHPAPDPINLLLSLGYGLLHNRYASALLHYGADPRQGFFHANRGSHWALASDLMEDTRFVVDSTVLRLVRSDKVSPDDFRMRNSRCGFANHTAFKTVMQIFETMFIRTWAHVSHSAEGFSKRKDSLNDWIDDAAAAFCLHVAGRKPYEPFRRRIWDIIW